MADTVADPRLTNARHAPRRPLRLGWSDPRVRNLFWQVVIIGLVVAVLWFLIHNTNRNLAARHIATGFGFLFQPASIPIGETPIAYTASVSTYGRAILIGILNTLKVSVIGIVLATILGTAVGIGRLSPNWLLARITAVYVEFVRDIPLLLQLFFWYGLLQALPAPRQAFHPLTGVFLSNRGIKLPALNWVGAHDLVLLAFVVGLLCTWAWSRFADRRQAATGQRPRTWPVAVLLLIVLPVGVWAALGAPFHLDLPALRGFNFQGGLTVTPEYAALLIGLVVYTATYIAEIVRSGILAVPQGQWEAGGALGLSRGVVLRRIVLPQALRVIIPPLASQYLNLIKNSSLAVAIGFQDIVSIANTTLTQTGQAIEGIAIIMAVYLCFSLSISAFMNWYNARIALRTR
ncbi:MAG TPA: amino acid ABC transporter permease [Acetobacteraceae bacterium]|nr:amino acid ABC transporter permease [Acetobacteraceae bacterium]